MNSTSAVPVFHWGLQGPTVLPLTNTAREAVLPSPSSAESCVMAK